MSFLGDMPEPVKTKQNEPRAEPQGLRNVAPHVGGPACGGPAYMRRASIEVAASHNAA